MNILKFLFLILIMSPELSRATLGADTALLSKILAESVAQLKELKEIYELQDKTFSEIEAMNSRVQQARYRIVRAKYIVDSTKTLSQSNTQSSKEVLRLMRNAKNLKSNAISFGTETDDWVKELNDLTPEEKKRILHELNKAEAEVKTIEEEIMNQKLAYHGKRMVQERANSDQEEGNDRLAHLVSINEAESSKDLDPKSAASETAKNTALTNTILMKKISVDTALLKEVQELNSKLEQEKINQLQKEKTEKDLWKIKINN